MRHFIVGAVLVLAALAVTSVTAQLLEQAAMNRRTTEGTTAIVEGPSVPASGKPGRSGELMRQVLLVSRRLTSDLKE
jgi:hypothetical protein